MDPWKRTAAANDVNAVPVAAPPKARRALAAASATAAATAFAASPLRSKRTIAQAAGEAGVGVETIRFYERERLIPRPPRPVAGYRIYPEATIRRIRFLRHCQELGFSLREAADLADNARCANACRHVEEKLAELDQKIAALGRLRDHLRAALDRQGGAECGVCETLRV